VFASRQCNALTGATSIEKGVSTMYLSGSNAGIRPEAEVRAEGAPVVPYVLAPE